MFSKEGGLDLAIKEKYVLVGLAASNIKRFEKLGYIIPRVEDRYGNKSVQKGTKIEVCIGDLPNGSGCCVTKVCDNCGHEDINIPYKNVVRHRKNGKDLCRRCAHKTWSDARRVNVVYEKSFGYLNPKVVPYWHPDNAQTPYEVSAFSELYKAKFICEEDPRHVYEMVVKQKSRGSSCPYCLGRKVDTTNCLTTTRPDISASWHPTKNKGLTPNDVTCFSNKYVWWKCLKPDCGHDWMSQVKKRSQGHGCPSCASSKGEARIRDFLNDLKLHFSQQKSFHDLFGVGGGKLFFDFVVEVSGKPSLAIEFDGIQHFKPTDFSGKGIAHANIVFKKQQENDAIKNEYCASKKIPLLRIKYTEYDEIEEIINEAILRIESDVA